MRVFNNVVHSCLSGIVVSGEFLNLLDRIEVRSNLVLGVKGAQFALSDYSKRKAGVLPCREVEFRDNTAIRTLGDTRAWNLPVSIDARMEAGGPGFGSNEGLVVENNRGYDLPAGGGGVWGRCVGLLEPRLTERDLLKNNLTAVGTQRAELISAEQKDRNQRALDSSVWVREANQAGRNALLNLPAVAQIRMSEVDAALDRGLLRTGTPYENVRAYLGRLGLVVSAPAAGGVPAKAPQIASRHELTAQPGPLQIPNHPDSAAVVAFSVPASVRADFNSGNRVWNVVLNLPTLSVTAVNRRECWYEVRGRKADGSWTASCFGWMPKNSWIDGQQCSNLGPVVAEALSGSGSGEIVLQFRAVSAPGLEPMEPLQVGSGLWKLVVQTVAGDSSYSAWPGVPAFEVPKEPLVLDWLEKARLQYGAGVDSAQVVGRAAPIQGRWEFERVENAGKPVLKCRFVPADSRYQTMTRDLPLAIVPRPVTVKAPRLRMVYGDPVPVADCEMDGVLEADRTALAAAYGWEVVAEKAVYAAQGRLAAGVHPLQPVRRAQADQLSNYRVTVSEGQVEVSRASAQFSVKDAGRFPGDPNPVFEGVWTGLRAGETAAQIQVTPRIWTEAAESSATGVYAIRVDGPQTAGNYQISYRPGRLQVFAPATPGFYVGLSERGAGNDSLGQRVVFRVMASGAYSLQMRMGTRLSASNSGRLSAANSGNTVLESELGRLGGDFNGLPGVIRLELAKDGYFSGEVVAQGQSPVPVRGWLCTKACGAGRFQVKDGEGAVYSWELEAANAGGGTLRGALPWGMGFRQLSQGAGPEGEVLVYSPMAGGGTLTGVIQATGADRWSGSASLWVPRAAGWQKAALQAP